MRDFPDVFTPYKQINLYRLPYKQINLVIVEIYHGSLTLEIGLRNKLLYLKVDTES